MFVGASLGPQLTGALTGLGSGGILLVIATVLVLGVLLALPTLDDRAPHNPDGHHQSHRRWPPAVPAASAARSVERLARVGIAVGVHYAGNKARTTTVTAAGGRAIAVGGGIVDEHATTEASDAVEREFSRIDAWSARKTCETGRRSP